MKRKNDSLVAAFVVVALMALAPSPALSQSGVTEQTPVEAWFYYPETAAGALQPAERRTDFLYLRAWCMVAETADWVANPVNRLDPGGISVLQTVRAVDLGGAINGQVRVNGVVMGWDPNPDPANVVDNEAFYVNLNPAAIDAGKPNDGINPTTWNDSVFVRNLIVAGRITMNVDIYGVDNPPLDAITDDPYAGKHIYDVAEGIMCCDAQPGDVVVISPDKDMTVVRSTQAADTRVAGVVSEDPKLHLGPGQGKQPVALAGIVRCNVSAENGAIRPGDMLVSAATVGHAMRWERRRLRPGTLVGKALQPLSQGTGKIYILVNKQ